MQTKLTDLMIFAAGFGSRMQKLTKFVPKPLIKVGCKALIDHTLSLQHKPNMNVIVNAHFKHSMVENHLKKDRMKLRLRKLKFLIISSHIYQK